MHSHLVGFVTLQLKYETINQQKLCYCIVTNLMTHKYILTKKLADVVMKYIHNSNTVHSIKISVSRISRGYYMLSFISRPISSQGKRHQSEGEGQGLIFGLGLIPLFEG